MSLESLYHNTDASVHETYELLRQAEAAAHTDADTFQARCKDANTRLEHIHKNCERLDVLVQKEPVTHNRRQSARIRVEQLKHDVRHLQSAVRAMHMRVDAREQDLRSREALLSTRFTTNAAAAGNVDGGSTSILIDKALEHQDALNRSNRGVDDLLSHGSSILENLREQRSTLKGIQKRLLDVASTLGLSSTVMRLIERRQEGDKWVLAGGMIVTMIIVVLVIIFWT